MGSLRKSVLLGVVAALVPAVAATAADYPMPPPVISYPPVEIGSGWYLRGDVGYKIYQTPNARLDVAGYGAMIDESISDTGTVGIGFGYRWNDNWRTDFTLDHEWPGEFHGRLNCPSGCTDAYSEEYADISATSFLVNAYWDIATFGGLTPYLGAGIGVSYLKTSDVHFVNPAGSVPEDGTVAGGSSWNLAWALMAGASYELSQRWLVDLNYRYLHLGNARSGPALGSEPLKYDDIRAHEIRLGLRYNIF